MGAVSPAPFADKEFMGKVNDRIAVPTMRGLRSEGIPFSGLPVLGPDERERRSVRDRIQRAPGRPRGAGHFAAACAATSWTSSKASPQAHLSERHVDTDDRSCATVVLASEGYPGAYEAGKPIVGLEMVRDALVFQSGTAEVADELVTNGGRVLSVSAFGKDIEHAIINCYKNVALIDYHGKYHRTDIGHDLLRKPTPKNGPAAPAEVK
jgi:phosphoribosylamine--glycine ligase